jgi:hypothetical protein
MDNKRTGSNLNRTMATLPTSQPERQQAFRLAASCKTCNTQLIWVKGSRVCSCANGHVYSYPSMQPLGGV